MYQPAGLASVSILSMPTLLNGECLLLFKACPLCFSPLASSSSLSPRVGVSRTRAFGWFHSYILTSSLVLTQDRSEDAFKAFKACRAESVETTDEHGIGEEFHLLRLQVVEEMKDFVPLKEFFIRPALRKRCFVGWLIMVAAQATVTIVINSEFISCRNPRIKLSCLTRSQIMAHSFTRDLVSPLSISSLSNAAGFPCAP